MEPIYLLTDYKGQFSCKASAVPYRSGMDIALLKDCFDEAGYTLRPLAVPDLDFRRMDFANQCVLCTDTEDPDCLYKSYLEDIYLALQLQQAVLIPQYKYIRAHHNKVFMELLRDLSPQESIKNIRSRHFGALEELNARKDAFVGAHIVKGAAGAKSRYVRLGRDSDELLAQAAVISRSPSVVQELWDFGRRVKHKGYVRDSRFRRKFIVQNFVPGLRNDWRVMVYGDRYYILYRETRDRDFRASGSGKFMFREEIPAGLLDFAAAVFESFDVPQISLDVGCDGEQFYLFEFQFILFGTRTMELSPFYFTRADNEWVRVQAASVLEEEYVRSVVGYLKQRWRAKQPEGARR